MIPVNVNGNERKSTTILGTGSSTNLKLAKIIAIKAVKMTRPKRRNQSLGIALNRIIKTGTAMIQIRILVNRSNTIPPKFSNNS
jgi:hypothetical protein